MRRMRRITWRQANDAFVATMREGVGPGVKIELNKSVRNFDMIALDGALGETFGSRAQKISISGFWGYQGAEMRSIGILRLGGVE
jgi:hypothetical protein